MNCKEFVLTNITSHNIYFNYRRCEDNIFENQVLLEPEQVKTIWLVENSYSCAFKEGIVLFDNGYFPPTGNTPSITPTPTNTSTQTPTPSVTSTQTPTSTPTPTETNTPTPTSTPAPVVSPLFIITNNSIKKTITDITISGVTVPLDLSGSYPVITGQTATGSSHVAFDGIAPNRMVVSVTGIGAYNYSIYQNNSLVISGGIFAGGIVVGPYNFADTDIIEVRIFD